VISTAPIRTSLRTPFKAFSMKFAGRCSPAYSVTPRAASAGLKEAIAASTARVTSSVFAPYWLDSPSMTPGFPMMSVSPNFGAAPPVTEAKSRSRSGVPLCAGITASPRASGVSVCPRLSMRTRLIWRLDESTAANACRGTHRRHHITEGEIAGIELARFHLDLKLPLVTSVQSRAGHSGHRKQPGPKGPLHEITQFHRRKLVADETQFQKVHGRRDQWRQFGRLDPYRKPRRDLSQRLCDDLP